MGKDIGIKKKACDSCHKKKIHCDAAVPSCNWCSHHDIACTFDRASKVATKRGKKKTPRDALSERLSRVEDIIAQARMTLQNTGLANRASHSSTASGSPAASDGTAAFVAPDSFIGKIHFAGFSLGQVSSYSGIPFFSAEGQKWIELRTGQKPTLEVLYLTGPPWQRDSRVDPSLVTAGFQPNMSFELPNQAEVERYASAFFESNFRLVFPLLDPVLFQRTLDLAYSPKSDPPSHESISARANIFGFISLISILQEDWNLLDEADGDSFSVKAQHLLPQILHDMNVTSLETVFFLSLRHLFCGRLQMAAMFQSLACRIMFMLEAHVHPTPNLPTESLSSGLDFECRMKSHLRNLFWLCFTVDKEISLRTGLPPTIDDDHCDLTLPPGYLDGNFMKNKIDHKYSLVTPIFPGELRLTLLKSKIYKVLYSAKAIRKSDAQLLKDIRELDDQLEQWRLSTPAPFRPSLSVSHDMCPDAGDNSPVFISMQRAFIHFEYHYLMATIHRASSRCRAWTERKSGEMNGVSSSLTLSLEASRSTLHYLRAAAPAVFGDAFWMVVFYPMSAVLTIFCHILNCPLDPQSERDLQLLTTTPELLKRVRRGNLPIPESVHLDMMDKFVQELIRLGKCALLKVREE